MQSKGQTCFVTKRLDWKGQRERTVTPPESHHGSTDNFVQKMEGFPYLSLSLDGLFESKRPSPSIWIQSRSFVGVFVYRLAVRFYVKCRTQFRRWAAAPLGFLQGIAHTTRVYGPVIQSEGTRRSKKNCLSPKIDPSNWEKHRCLSTPQPWSKAQP